MLQSLRPCSRNPLVWLLLLLTVRTGEASQTEGHNPAWGPKNAQPFERTLRKSFRASLSGNTLRGMLDAIREATAVPYWLDRRIDPDQLVDAVAARSDIEQAYMDVANAADLAALPVDGVVIIGRAAWVDRVGAAWLSPSAQRERGRSPPLSIDWPPLTTPSEALRRAGFDAAATDLPHDLWPGFRVEAIQPSTLLLLIGAQFDRLLEPEEGGTWQVRPLPERVTIVRRYPANARTHSVRSAALERDPTTKWEVEQQQIIVEANPRIHRLIIRTLNHEGTAGDRKNRPSDRGRSAPKQATFRFELKNAPAGAALATLAKSAGWKLKIAPLAQPACQRRISFDGQEDATLEQWVQRIVAELNLTAVREGETLLIETN